MKYFPETFLEHNEAYIIPTPLRQTALWSITISYLQDLLEYITIMEEIVNWMEFLEYVLFDINCASLIKAWSLSYTIRELLQLCHSGVSS